MASIDPSTLATQLATAYTQSAQSLLTTQNTSSKATSTALTKLQTALQGFDSAMKTLSGKKSLSQFSGAFGNTATGTAEVGAGALPGSYQVFVEKLASAHQVAFQNIPAEDVSAWPGGPLNMSVNLANGSNFVVNLANADADADGSLSQIELARAINQASGNGGNVTAQVVSAGGQSQLMLSSGVSGEGGKISLDTSGIPAGGLRTALEDPARQQELVAAEDAVVWMGAQGWGLQIKQGSNTLTAIPGVTITLKGLSSGAPDVLTVSKDDSATTANVQSFVDAYNALKKSLDDLTAPGKDGAASAAFTSDAGVRSLRSRLNNMLRQDFGGMSLRDLGVSADRNGQLSLDSAKLSKTLSANPDALDTVFGKASTTTNTGVLGGFSQLVDQWTNTTTGQIGQRKTSVAEQQKTLTDRQTRLDAQYDQAYTRYLRQFTALQEVQARLSDTSSLLGSLSTSTA